ncbi:hypothetical protein B0H15DRAFT_773113 [Mycena belliarum]|uniref:Uncharacterized protein n=1 Tax=Mycena belliarum TaxID=1033014 RepID=A0AAD6XT49_9AGAR|nr:hypothetical protein B0H15DRAFT_773113 [Mycena belliae]
MSRITEAIHTLRYSLPQRTSVYIAHSHRGEHFRHTQNQKRLPPNLKTRSFLAHNCGPTLPDLFAHSAYSKEKPRPRDTREALFHARRAEPAQRHQLAFTPTGRAEALSVVLPSFAECQGVPSLTLLCLQILITTSFDVDFAETILPFIPPHLCHELLRWTAVYHPLVYTQIRAVCGPEGHAAGELIIIGPNANVCEDEFKSPEHGSTEWDSDDWIPQPPMHTVIIVSSHLRFSTLTKLPVTLTHLALVDLLAPVSLHRLPATCPLIECLDLSYNSWLVAEEEAKERLDTVNWSRWHQLHTLGVRGCHFAADMIREVNKSRWRDVKVIE